MLIKLCGLEQKANNVCIKKLKINKFTREDEFGRRKIMKSKSTIKKQEKKLRKFIEKNSYSKGRKTLIQVRLAYVIEDTIRWTRLKDFTKRCSRKDFAKSQSEILYNQLIVK